MGYRLALAGIYFNNLHCVVEESAELADAFITHFSQLVLKTLGMGQEFIGQTDVVGLVG
jgi:hypothetical protein